MTKDDKQAVEVTVVNEFDMSAGTSTITSSTLPSNCLATTW